MSEPHPSDQYETGERLVQREVVRRLRAAGWLVVVTSQARSTGRQTAGLPDLLAFRRDHTLLLEVKSPMGKLREAQRLLLLEITPHEGPHLTYAVVRHPADVTQWETEKPTLRELRLDEPCPICSGWRPVGGQCERCEK